MANLICRVCAAGALFLSGMICGSFLISRDMWFPLVTGVPHMSIINVILVGGMALMIAGLFWQVGNQKKSS